MLSTFNNLNVAGRVALYSLAKLSVSKLKEPEDVLVAIVTSLTFPGLCLIKKRFWTLSPLPGRISHMRSTFVLFTPSTTIFVLSGLLVKVKASKNNTKTQKIYKSRFSFQQKNDTFPSSSKAILLEVKIPANLSSKAYQIAVVMRQQSKHSPITSKEYSLDTLSSLLSWMNIGTSFTVLIQRIFNYKECSFIFAEWYHRPTPNEGANWSPDLPDRDPNVTMVTCEQGFYQLTQSASIKRI